MTREVTLRIEESSYEQFMGFIRLYSQVEVVSESETARRGRGGRPKRAGKPVVKAFSYHGREKAARR
jgi:hypothetical protein